VSDTAADLRYLADNVGWLAHQTYALAAFEELTHAAAVIIESAIRQPPPALWYAGPCDTCRRDLYARYGEPEVTCTGCNLIYDVEDRREWLLTVVEDRLERAVVICRALSAFGHDVSRHRLGMWQTRGLIAPRSHDEKGYPLYRVGDVLDILNRLEAKAS
jgi:hypothetical protein